MEALGITPFGLIAYAVNFALLAVLLRLFLYKPVKEMLHRRQTRIAEGLEAADKATEDARRQQSEFQQELAKDPEVGWLCLNCHTPASDQQEELTLHTGSVREPERSPSPGFSAAFRDEGLTCVGCHWRPEGIAGPFGDTEAPHAVVQAPELLDNSACTSCHQASTSWPMIAWARPTSPRPSGRAAWWTRCCPYPGHRCRRGWSGSSPITSSPPPRP